MCDSDILEEMCKVMKISYDRKLITTRDGSVSFRYKDNNYFYITPSGIKKYELTRDQLIIYDINQNEDMRDTSQNKKLKPSGELPLHYLLQKNSKEDRCVLHLHPTYIVAAMYSGYDLQSISKDFPEINRYTRVGPNVGIIPPLTNELAEECKKCLGLKETGEILYDIVGIDRHGIVSIGKDIWDAFEHVERLEHICKIILSSHKKL